MNNVDVEKSNDALETQDTEVVAKSQESPSNTVIKEWAVESNFKVMKRAYRVYNPNVKTKEVVYEDAIKVVAIAIDMLNSNIKPLSDVASDFTVEGRFYTRKEYLEVATSNIMKLIAPRAVTIDGEDETKGRINLRVGLERTNTEMVTPLKFKEALQELARYAGCTYSPSNEASDGKDAIALANVNPAGKERCLCTGTLPIDVVGVESFVTDRAFNSWTETVVTEVLDDAMKF